MSSSVRKITACGLRLAALFLLAACGFHPMYGEHSALAEKSPLSGNLVIAQIHGHDGQILKISLEDLLNPEGIKSASPEYRLQVSLTKNLIPAVVQSDGTIQRYDMKINSSFQLIRIADGKQLLTGQVSRTSSYNVAVNANFATYEASQDVIVRSMHELAEDYVLRLSGYFAGQK